MTEANDGRYVTALCYCFGPRGGGFHGTDEWVDVDSLEQTAVTVAPATAAWVW